MVTTPTGRLMKKAQRHPSASTISPPSDGPNAADIAPMAPQMAMTCGIFSRGKAAMTSASDDGTRIAAPTPWRMRAPISTHTAGARPHAIDATVKVAEPTRKARWCPPRSATFPAGTRSAANAMV